MALTFPLSIADFIDQLPIKSVMMTCPETSEMSQTGGGEIISASTGARLWQGTVELGRMTRRENRQVRSLIDVAQTAGASFLIYDTTAAEPLDAAVQPDLSGQTITLQSLSPTDTGLIALQGFASGYKLARGDYLSFRYRSDPERFALHTVAELDVTADSAGTTPLFRVTPNIRPGAQVGASITFNRAHCKALIVPGSVQAGRTARFKTEGASFNFIQTLR